MADALFDLDDVPVERRPEPAPTPYVTDPYPYLRADGAAVARPLFQAGEGGSTPTSALHLRFERIDYDTARALNAAWHSVLPNMHISSSGGGPIPAQCYVAEHDDLWYAVAIWTAPVNRDLGKLGDRILELRRMAIAPTAPKNTASRMLGYMARDLPKRLPTVERLISYQATEHHAGTIYKASGWAPVGYKVWVPWSNARRRGVPQTTSDKVRWELQVGAAA